MPLQYTKTPAKFVKQSCWISVDCTIPGDCRQLGKARIFCNARHKSRPEVLIRHKSRGTSRQEPWLQSNPPIEQFDTLCHLWISSNTRRGRRVRSLFRKQCKNLALFLDFRATFKVASECEKSTIHHRLRFVRRRVHQRRSNFEPQNDRRTREKLEQGKFEEKNS